MNAILQQVTDNFIFDGDMYIIGRSFRKYLSIRLIELIIREIENEKTI
jgi:hypothetical protein